MKQSKPQYQRKGYGAGDKSKKAKPVGYRYLRIIDKKTGRFRAVTKDDKEYYAVPTSKLISAYESGDKTARKMLYTEKRTDHSDKTLSGRSFKKGGAIEKIKFNELVDHIQGLDFDGDESDLRLHSDEYFSWSADNEEEYNKAEKEIDSIEYKGKGWEIYASYDVSGFGYWVERQHEYNHIHITVSFDDEFIDESEIDKINEALDSAISDAYRISEKYDYNPENYGEEDEFRKGGSLKQKHAQYGHDDYGNRDSSVKARPVGYRYRKIRDKKTGRMRDVRKGDAQYYKTPSKKIIGEYERGDKLARRSLYFEDRKDHSDKAPLKSLRKFAKGGNVTIGDYKAKYKVKYSLDNESPKEGFIVAVMTPSGHAIDHYLLYDKQKKLVKELVHQEAQELVKKGKITMVKTYDVENARMKSDENMPVKDMGYSERGQWIQDKIIPKLKSAELLWVTYGGDSYDINDKKSNEKFSEDVRKEADFSSEKDFNKNSGFKVGSDGWTIETEDGEELEEITSGNTYNWSYLGLFDWNFRVYEVSDDKYFLIAHPHMGGDVRGNYGDPIFFEGDSEESVMYKFREQVLDGNRSVRLVFKDKTELSFDATQDSDVSHYELYETGKKLKLNSPAEIVVSTFKSFGSYNGDEFLEEIANNFK